MFSREYADWGIAGTSGIASPPSEDDGEGDGWPSRLAERPALVLARPGDFDFERARASLYFDAASFLSDALVVMRKSSRSPRFCN